MLTLRRPLGIAACLLGVCSAPGQGAESVQALRYGVTLYHFYQQDYFTALTELMAAQQLSALDVHAGNAELLRAGMSLSYGMDRVAEQIFMAMLSRDSPGAKVDADRAWFYLAKLAWQRDELQRADEALARMSPQYRGPLADEANYLRAALSLRRGDESLAREYAQRLPDGSPWRYYHYYNSGAARAASGDWSSATDYFSRFDAMVSPDPEGSLLRDKAYTAAGFAQMSMADWGSAQAHFSRVGLDSALSDRALLGYGWAYVESGDFHGALDAWWALSQRPPISESVRAGMLALPFAYEQLGENHTALSGYRRAAEVYTSEITVLDKAIERFRSADLDSLLGVESASSSAWLSGPDYLPVNDQAPYLRHLVSKHSFQLALREWIDLQQLASHLSGAKERLEVLARVDAEQQRSWSGVVEEDRLTELVQRQQSLQLRIVDLRRELQAEQAAQNERWFGEATQFARWQRLDRVKELARELGGSPEESELLELYQGLLLWEDSEQYPALYWQRNRQLQELEELAEKSEAYILAVNKAVARGQHSSFISRISALTTRVDAQRERANAALVGSETNIRQVALAELENQRDQMWRALGRSRLAIARIYDVASTESQR